MSVPFVYCTGRCSAIGTNPKSGETDSEKLVKCMETSAITVQPRGTVQGRKDKKNTETIYSQRVIPVSPLL